MANNTKPDVNTIWGSGGALSNPGTAKTALGWVVEIPAYQEFNWLLNRQDSFNAHVNEMGIPLWDVLTTYSEGSKVVINGDLFDSIVDSNTGNSPADVNTTNSFWRLEVSSQYAEYGAVGVYASAANIDLQGSDDYINKYYAGVPIHVRGTNTGNNYYGNVRSVLDFGSYTRITVKWNSDSPTLTNEPFDFVRAGADVAAGGPMPYMLKGLVATGTSSNALSGDHLIYLDGQVVAAYPETTKFYADTASVSVTEIIAIGTAKRDEGFFSLRTVASNTNILELSALYDALTFRYTVNNGAMQTITTLLATQTSQLTLPADSLIEFTIISEQSGDVQVASGSITTYNTSRIMGYVQVLRDKLATET